MVELVGGRGAHWIVMPTAAFHQALTLALSSYVSTGSVSLYYSIKLMKKVLFLCSFSEEMVT